MSVSTTHPADLRLRRRPPAICTSITANGGMHRYHVYAYKPLNYAEVVRAIALALREAWIEVPEDGEEVSLYTSIGSCRDGGASPEPHGYNRPLIRGDTE